MATVRKPHLDELKLVELPFSTKLKVCIFDLDETLIHSVDDINSEPY